MAGSLYILVSYSGREIRIPLVVIPSLELTDLDVDRAELELCQMVRHVFNIPVESGFSLHEAETNCVLTKESYRDPRYIQSFPLHWYLTVEKTAGEAGEEEEEVEKVGEIKLNGERRGRDGRREGRDGEREREAAIGSLFFIMILSLERHPIL